MSEITLMISWYGRHWNRRKRRNYDSVIRAINATCVAKGINVRCQAVKMP